MSSITTSINSTTQTTLECSPANIENLFELVDDLPRQDNSFVLGPVSYNEILTKLKSLRSDYSTGPDQIPTKLIKPVAEYLASPICHIMKSCIAKSTFPSQWKIARISSIPKTKDSKSMNDYMPVSKSRLCPKSLNG